MNDVRQSVLLKEVTGFSRYLFSQNASSEIFGRVLNAPLKIKRALKQTSSCYIKTSHWYHLSWSYLLNLSCSKFFGSSNCWYSLIWNAPVLRQNWVEELEDGAELFGSTNNGRMVCPKNDITLVTSSSMKTYKKTKLNQNQNKKFKWFNLEWFNESFHCLKLEFFP